LYAIEAKEKARDISRCELCNKHIGSSAPKEMKASQMFTHLKSRKHAHAMRCEEKCKEKEQEQYLPAKIANIIIAQDGKRSASYFQHKGKAKIKPTKQNVADVMLLTQCGAYYAAGASSAAYVAYFEKVEKELSAINTAVTLNAAAMNITTKKKKGKKSKLKSN
jgi:hypothetical protein